MHRSPTPAPRLRPTGGTRLPLAAIGALLACLVATGCGAAATPGPADTSPLRDAASGQRLRVTVSAGCPAGDTGVVGVTNTGSDLAGRMLPQAQPTGGLLCRYFGLNGGDGLGGGASPSGGAFTLETQKALDATAAQSLASSVAQLPLGQATGVECSCPMADGSAAVVVLAYPGRADVDLWVLTNGCSSIANGDLALASCGNPAVASVVTNIAALVGE